MAKKILSIWSSDQLSQSPRVSFINNILLFIIIIIINTFVEC